MTAAEALGHRFLTESFAEVPPDLMPPKVADEKDPMRSARERSQLYHNMNSYVVNPRLDRCVNVSPKHQKR